MNRGLLLGLLVVSGSALAWGDGPEISRSMGKKGGVVVLWPRTPEKEPAGADQLAKVQTALASIAEGVAEQVDIRPAPERVCPRAKGCRAASIGAVMAQTDGGCALVAVISPPGTSSATLVPWVGTLKLKDTKVPFREPPESRVSVVDFGTCADFDLSLTQGRDPVVEALRKALAQQ